MKLPLSMPVLVSLCLSACGGLEAPAPASPEALGTATQASAVNENAGFLMVYNVNYENLPTPNEQCAGDWQDLVYSMKAQTYSPDVIIVHQMSGAAQAAQLARFVEDTLPGQYASIVAEANPSPMNSPCGPAKDYQTNAIIYRTGRLQPVTGTKETWQVYKGANGACVRNNQSRSIGVRMAFTDLINGKTVVLGSAHWPTMQDGPASDPSCAEQNLQLTDARMRDVSGAHLRIWGVDANESDHGSNGYRDWYKQAMAQLPSALDYAWNDPIYEACAGGRSCLEDNWSGGAGGRIDFLFFNAAASASQGHTVTYNEGDAAALQFTGADREDLNYSGHRAQRARIHY
jgi:hypothetical protein